MIQQRFDALPIDEVVAASYGQLAAAVIAATAHAHGARLSTRNADDLRGLGDLLDVVSV
ncbi:hypothetical protein SAMN06264364_10319 [Quadrisphaera granulorum]|uniref:PIN domain-containing protein n=1 Tax=Quadrisphaera granulorum TaxID=317664 RepID=A0A316AEE6_9ACTN|nr:hypothetical protein [Quadrisphaera granulorum]PWJ55350.1 hypothetical protein BXY45_10319 [Quadrisphaera granulorum]SZE95414.1 hypothetical protein SAMN06264364_10319 [Quadrisphaera granulorum]